MYAEDLLYLRDCKEIFSIMKNLFKFILFSLFAVTIAACSDSEDYNPDTAVSLYEPVPGRRMVAQVKTTNNVNGRDYSWEHNFSYDAQGRIKEINSNIVHYRAVSFENRTYYYLCNITSKANYYFYGDKFHVEYSISKEYPDMPSWNTINSGKDQGLFNENGTIAKMATIDLTYSFTQLKLAYADGGFIYEPKRDERGNVIGYVVRYQMDAASDSLMLDRSKEYMYSGTKNNTNFDFSGYFGYWGIERGIDVLKTEYYAPYQLTAFGMMGASSNYLPIAMLSRDSKGNVVKDEKGNSKYLEGEWTFDSAKYPVQFVDGSGRKTEIRYVD